MALTNDQIHNLIYDHAHRVIDNMDTRTLILYAVDQLVENLRCGGLDNLVQDIIDYEGGDLDSASEFMEGAGIPADEVDQLLA